MTLHTHPEQFTSAGISIYYVRDSELYEYTVTGWNDYPRSVLDMAGPGWPGGLRRLHEELGRSRQKVCK